jgi:protein O-GlcNAc transferase
MNPSSLQSAIELHRAGRLTEAESIYREILATNPNDAIATNLLGMIAGQTNRPQLAIDLFRRASELNPNFYEAHYNLAAALQSQGSLPSAIDSFQRAIHLNPNLTPALYNLAACLKSAGRIEETIDVYRRAIHLEPDRAEVHYNLANALQLMSRYDEAITSYQCAIQLNPDYAEAHNNLGLVLAEQGQLDKAISECRKAIQLKPDASDGYINLLYTLYHHPDYDSARLLEENRQWSRRQPAISPINLPRRDPTPNRRVRIGYLSPFFGQCADAHYILPLLAHHDRKQFEIFCYSRAIREDDITARMQPHADYWLDLRHQAIESSVNLIRGHEIDILINISRPADECLSIMASRVAPIQITWLTFASCTSGLDTMDYRISDPFLDPPGTDESSYSEKTLRVSETAWCYDPLTESPPVKPLPAQANGFITFGSLNRFSKINSKVIAAWTEILNTVPNSRLHILAVPGSHRQRLLDQLRIDPARIEFIGRQPRFDYLNEYNRIDITLDTFPFSGHTTTLDSLWMGVPIVTLSGQTCVSRAAVSALHNLSRADLIAKTPQEYVSIAARLSQDINELADLCASLRDRMQKSPLTDGPRFAAQIEQIYRDLLPR